MKKCVDKKCQIFYNVCGDLDFLLAARDGSMSGRPGRPRGQTFFRPKERSLMGDTGNAFDFIERLKEQGKEKKPTFGTLLDYLYAKAGEKGIPLGGQFELTPLCNFDCKMCYTHLTREQLHGRKLLTVEQWKDLMTQAWQAGMMSANLTGGECLTYPGFDELYLHLHSLGCEVLVLTNGLLLDEKWVRFFKAHPPGLIQVTLYGGDEDTYERVTGRRAFSQVTEHIRSARDAGLPVAVTITPCKYLGEGVFDTMRAAKALNVPYHINPDLTDPKEETGRSGQDHGISVEDYARIYEFWNELEGYETIPVSPDRLPPAGGLHRECSGCGLTCKAGKSCFTLEWDGRMYACGSIRDIWASPLEEGFRAAWDKVHQKALQWPIIPECVECPYVSVCTNCAPVKASFTERGKQPLKLCEQTKYLVQRGVKKIPACE